MSEDLPHDNILEGILPTESPAHTPRERPLEVFQAWHLPRKHHVRKHLWAKSLDRLLDTIPDRILVKYLGLPGEDLLDLQIFADVCRAKGRRLKYLGFDQSQNRTGASTQRVAAQQIIHQTNVVDTSSEVLPDDFTSIANQQSIAYQHLHDGGSYDFVNLDMCDAFTAHAWSPTHDAVRELVTYQANHRAEPWLLSITTRTEVARLDRAELDAYAGAITRNATQSGDFCECLADIADIQEAMEANVLTASIRERLAGDTYLSGRWLALGIGKWLLGMMAQADPWRVDLLSIGAYRTGLLSHDGTRYAGEPANLFSMTFRFGKIHHARNDPAGLANQPRAERVPVNELKLAEKLARCVRKNTHDIDRIMQENAAAARELCDECASLLEVRYYSPDAYRAWLGQLPRIAI